MFVKVRTNKNLTIILGHSCTCVQQILKEYSPISIEIFQKNRMWSNLANAFQLLIHMCNIFLKTIYSFYHKGFNSKLYVEFGFFNTYVSILIVRFKVIILDKRLNILSFKLLHTRG